MFLKRSDDRSRNAVLTKKLHCNLTILKLALITVLLISPVSLELKSVPLAYQIKGHITNHCLFVEVGFTSLFSRN